MQVTAIDSVVQTGARRNLVAPPRSSVAEVVELAYPGTPMALRRDIVVATINGVEVPVEAWERVRPKVGTVVILRPVPQGDVLRNVLTIAVVISAIALAQFAAPLLATQLGLAAGGVGQGLLTAGITGTPFVGSMLRDALA